MTESQLYLAIGVPSGVALIGILVNVGYFIALNGRMSGIDGRMTAIEAKLGSVAEQTAIHKTLLDVVLKKLDELESRVHRP